MLYPPTTALLFAPFLVLSRELFVLIPILVTAWSVWRWQPAAWTWPLMALCLLWPTTPLKVVSGNPSLWVAAAVALGLRFGWPGVFILLKPTFLPFAFIGLRRRSYWIAAAALALVSLPMLDAILVYPQVLVDSRGGGLAYSLPDWPTAFVPLLAWIGSLQRIAIAEMRIGPARTHTRVPGSFERAQHGLGDVRAGRVESLDDRQGSRAAAGTSNS